MDSGATAGAVIGGLLLGVCLMGVVIWAWRRCRGRRRLLIPSLTRDEVRFKRRLEQIDELFDDRADEDEETGLNEHDLAQLRQLETELARKGKLPGRAHADAGTSGAPNRKPVDKVLDALEEEDADDEGDVAIAVSPSEAERRTSHAKQESGVDEDGDEDLESESVAGAGSKPVASKTGPAGKSSLGRILVGGKKKAVD